LATARKEITSRVSRAGKDAPGARKTSGSIKEACNATRPDDVINMGTAAAIRPSSGSNATIRSERHRKRTRKSRGSRRFAGRPSGSFGDRAEGCTAYRKDGLRGLAKGKEAAGLRRCWGKNASRTRPGRRSFRIEILMIARQKGAKRCTQRAGNWPRRRND